MVGRCEFRFSDLPPADSSGFEFRAFRNSLLDNGHRRFRSGDPDDPAYRELFVRWFQYGTFNPILRVHGTRKTDQNELWSYGADEQKSLVNYDRLRFRMLPYIYSLAWQHTSEGYTSMRPLRLQ